MSSHHITSLNKRDFEIPRKVRMSNAGISCGRVKMQLKIGAIMMLAMAIAK